MLIEPSGRRRVAGTPGRHRRPLYDLIMAHPTMRDRLRALNQARHDGYDPDEVEAVRRALWTIHQATGRPA